MFFDVVWESEILINLLPIQARLRCDKTKYFYPGYTHLEDA